jgi:hypothetical protein
MKYQGYSKAKATDKMNMGYLIVNDIILMSFSIVEAMNNGKEISALQKMILSDSTFPLMTAKAHEINAIRRVGIEPNLKAKVFFPATASPSISGTVVSNDTEVKAKM